MHRMTAYSVIVLLVLPSICLSICPPSDPMRSPWFPLKDGHYHVRDDRHINVTLNYPPDHGNFTRSNWNIVLNATLRTSGSDATVELYASDEPSIDGENCLVHRRTGAANGTTVRYNLDSLPAKPDPSTVLLLHFDNRSEQGENATHVRDFSGNGNNGTVMGGAVHKNTGGKFAGAFELDRTDDYVTVPHNSNFNSVNRSAECWMKLDMEGHIGYLLGRQGWGVNESYLMIRYSWSFITAWVGNGTSQPSVSYQLPAGNRTGVWHHVAATYDDEVLRLYVNGVERGNASVPGGVASMNRPWRIGVAPAWQGDFLNGTIDEVAIYDRKLSSEEIEGRYRLSAGKYYWQGLAFDGQNENRTEMRDFFVDPRHFAVEMSHPGHEVTTVHGNATYNITVTNLGEASDDYSLYVRNPHGARTAFFDPAKITGLAPGASTNVTLTVGSPTPGRYVVTGEIKSDTNLGSYDSVEITTSSLLDTVGIGTYGICEQWQGAGDHVTGVNNIKSFGGSAVILSLGDGWVTFPSDHCIQAHWAADDMVSNLVEYAHREGLRIYAWYGMPHNYWLAPERYPEWISVYLNGSDCQYPIVPPSRVLSTPDYLAQLRGVIGEMADLGFDGIDINDNFHFISDTSFDNFTLDKFENATGIDVPGGSEAARGQFLWTNDTIRERWFEWRCDEVNELLGLLQDYVNETGKNVPMRPHLMTHASTYWDNGYDRKTMVETVDVAYLMLQWGEGPIRECVQRYKKYGPREMVGSIYLDTVAPGDHDRLGKCLRAAADEDLRELLLFSYTMIDAGGLWETVRNSVPYANRECIPNITVGGPRMDENPVLVTDATPFNITVANRTMNGSFWYRLDEGYWRTYGGNFTVAEPGAHTIEYYYSHYIGQKDALRKLDIYVSNSTPVSNLTVLEPKYGVNPVYITSNTEFNITSFDNDAGINAIRYSIDGGNWTDHSGNFTVTTPGPHSLSYYSVNDLLEAETPRSLDIFVDDDAPVSLLSPGSPNFRDDVTYITSETEMNITAGDNGSGVAIVRYRIDDGNWTSYGGNFTVPGTGSHTISYTTSDALGNAEPIRNETVFVDDEPPEVSCTHGNATNGTLRIWPGEFLTFLVTDGGVGKAEMYYRTDVTGSGDHNESGWLRYDDRINLNRSVNLSYYAQDVLGNKGEVERLEIIVFSMPDNDTQNGTDADPGNGTGNGTDVDPGNCTGNNTGNGTDGPDDDEPVNNGTGDDDGGSDDDGGEEARDDDEDPLVFIILFTVFMVLALLMVGAIVRNHLITGRDGKVETVVVTEVEEDLDGEEIEGEKVEETEVMDEAVESAIDEAGKVEGNKDMSNEDVVEDEGEKAEEAEVVKAKATVEEKGDEAGVESEGNANDNTE